MRTALLLFFIAITGSTFAQGIDFFHGTWQEAIEEAQKQERIIFVDAYTTWCGPCKRMSKYVFTEKKAGEFFNSNFINIKIDMEKTNGREFGAKYPVSAYPTLFFLDPNGKMLKKAVGGKQLDALLDLGNKILSEFDFSAKYREAYENGDRSFENVTNYIDALNKSGKSSLKIANEYIRDNPELTPDQKTEFYFKAASEVDSRIFEEIMDREKEVVRLFGEQALQDKVRLSAINTIDKAIKFEHEDLMKNTLKQVKKYDRSLAKELQIESDMKWAYAKNDEKGILKASKKFVKQDLSFDKKLDWAKEILAAFPKNKDVQELVYENMTSAVKTTTERDVISFYSKLLLDMGKKNEALTFAKNAEKRLEDKNTLSYLKNLIKYIENYNS